MLLTVCIEAGRKTLTHTSWTGLAPVSRKWMSGQAAALAARNDRWPLANLTASSPLRESSLLSARRPPSPLDFYLSWMSPGLSSLPARNLPQHIRSLCVESQATAIGVLLGFLGFGIFAFEVSKRYFQRLVTESDLNDSADAACVNFLVADEPGCAHYVRVGLLCVERS